MLVQEEEAVAVVCLQVQRVTGLPAAVQQIQLGCHHLGPGREAAPVRARACASRGVADFHNQVLLLHCGTAVTSHSVLLTVSVSSSSSYQLQHLGGVDLGQRQPGTEILSFVLSGAAAGAVLTLALHNRLVPPRTTNYNSCLPLPACCRRSKRQHQQQQGYDSDESAGFITIEKQPPSDNLVTTDDQDQDQDVDSSSSSSRVEDEFLAMLETETDLDLDMLVKDAEAELILARAHLLKDENAAASLM